jgi:hypothetical protein
MNNRTWLEVKPLEARLQISIDAQQKRLKKQTDCSLADMETRLLDTRISLEENPFESRVLTTIDKKLDLLKKHNDDSLTSLKTEFNGLTDKHNEKIENLSSVILNNTERLLDYGYERACEM